MTIAGYLGSFEIIVILLAGLVIFVVPIIALVDVLRNEFEGNNKIIWVLVILLSWILGAVLYFFIGRNQKLENK